MTFDCLVLPTHEGPARTVAMRIDLFVDVAPAADALVALDELAAAQSALVEQWRRTMLVDARCPVALAAAPAHAGARVVQRMAEGVTPTGVASHLLRTWSPEALSPDTFTVRKVAVCFDGWDAGSCGETGDAAALSADVADLPDAAIPKTKRSSRSAFGRKRYVPPT